MDYMAFAAAIASAIFWYRGAETENLPPLYWVGPSLGISAVVIVALGGGWIITLLSQVGLFAIITLYRTFIAKEQDGA
jgi:hypothetical protein